jgi:transposase
MAKRGFVLLPTRWVGERSHTGMKRFRRLVRDDERLSQILAGVHFLVSAIVMLTRFITLIAQSA